MHSPVTYLHLQQKCTSSTVTSSWLSVSRRSAPWSVNSTAVCPTGHFHAPRHRLPLNAHWLWRCGVTLCAARVCHRPARPGPCHRLAQPQGHGPDRRDSRHPHRPLANPKGQQPSSDTKRHAAACGAVCAAFLRRAGVLWQHLLVPVWPDLELPVVQG